MKKSTFTLKAPILPVLKKLGDFLNKTVRRQIRVANVRPRQDACQSAVWTAAQGGRRDVQPDLEYPCHVRLIGKAAQ